jgi:hypothetical protein
VPTAAPAPAAVSFAESVKGPFSVAANEERVVMFDEFASHASNTGLESVFTKPVAEIYSDVYAVPKAARPPVETYIPKPAIEAHVAEFDAGASRFMTESNLAKYGPAQRDGTAFVMPKAQADKLLADAGGDAAKFEEALGLPSGTLQTNPMVRVDFPHPRDLNVRMPRGTEAGANSQWLPGGYLPNGQIEAVVDLGVAKPGAYTTTPVVTGAPGAGGVAPALRQGGMSKLALPRTEGLGSTSTTAELLNSGAIPGREGVILQQRTVPYADIWKMSEKSGVEFLLTKENGNWMLRSGSPTSVPIPGGVRPTLHTHPLDADGLNSLLPSKADINVLNDYWARNPTAPRPVSQILTGQPEPTRFYATGLEPWKGRSK